MSSFLVINQTYIRVCHFHIWLCQNVIFIFILLLVSKRYSDNFIPCNILLFIAFKIKSVVIFSHILFAADPQVQDLLYEVTHEKNCTEKIIGADVLKKQSEARLNEQSTRVGLLFASKSAVQLFTNPFIGPLTNK